MLYVIIAVVILLLGIAMLVGALYIGNKKGINDMPWIISSMAVIGVLLIIGMIGWLYDLINKEKFSHDDESKEFNGYGIDDY